MAGDLFVKDLRPASKDADGPRDFDVFGLLFRGGLGVRVQDLGILGLPFCNGAEKGYQRDMGSVLKPLNLCNHLYTPLL